MGHKFSDANSALTFILAGNATFTVVSNRTGMRYTFRVRKAKNVGGIWFVSLLTGPDNESSYTYVGIIRMGSFARLEFRLTGKSKMKNDSLPVKAFTWILDLLARNTFPNNAEIWHEGRCGRCNRLLTVPQSIESGFGPECINMVKVA